MTSRRTAWLLLVALTATLILAVKARGDTVHHMPQAKLEQAARRLATHGGVTGSCAGCATLTMQRLDYELVYRAFPARARNWAICVARRESGLNVGAISPDHDFGLPQIHVAAHPEYNAYRLTHDPVYSVQAFRRLSNAGRDRQPWTGGRWTCP